MLLTSHIKEFVEWKGTHRIKVVYSYNLWLNRFDTFINRNIESIDVKDIVAWSEYLDANYSSTTKSYAMTLLHTFFSFWNKRIKCLPADLIVSKRVKANSHKAVTDTEYNEILKTFNNESFQGLRNTCIIRILGECGMRVSELTDLLVSDMNLRDRMAIIRTKKTRNERRIVWSEATNSYLLQYLQSREKITKSPYLFIGFFTDGRPTDQLTPRSVQRVMKKACKDSHIETKISPHGMRHRFARDKRRKGSSIAFLQTALGHSNPLTTIDTYSQFGIDEWTDEARRYLDEKEPLYTPPIRKIEQEQERQFQQIKDFLTNSSKVALLMLSLPKMALFVVGAIQAQNFAF